MGIRNDRLPDADPAAANAERYFDSNYTVRLVPGLNQLFSGIREIPELREVPHEKDPRRQESERREEGLRESRNAQPLKTVTVVDIGEDDWRPLHRIKIPPTRAKLPSKIKNMPNYRDPRRLSAIKRVYPENYQPPGELPTLVHNEFIPEEEETCAVLVIDSSDWPNSKHCWVELIPHECNVARALLDVQDIMSDDGGASMRRDNAEADEPVEVRGEGDLFQRYSQAEPRSPPRGASKVEQSNVMSKSFDIECVFYEGESLRRRRISDPQIIVVKEDDDIDEIVCKSSRPVPRIDGEPVDIVDLCDDDEPVLPNKQSSEHAKKAQCEATRAALEVVTLDDEDDCYCDPGSSVNDLNFMNDSSDELPWLDPTDVFASSTLTNNAAECLSSSGDDTIVFITEFNVSPKSSSRDDAIGFITNFDVPPKSSSRDGAIGVITDFDVSPKSTSPRLNTDDLLHVPKSKFRRSHFANRPATSDHSSRVTIIESGPVVNNESRAASRDKPGHFQEHRQREPRDFAAAAERRADGSQSRREKSRGRSHKNRSENERNVATAHSDRGSCYRSNYSPTFKSHSSVDETRRKSSSGCSDAKTKHSHSRHEKSARSAERDNRRCRESRERANVPVELDSRHSRNEIARHSNDKESPRSSKTDDSKKRERPEKKDKKDREDKSAGDSNRHSLPAPSVPSRKENKERTATSAIKKTEERTATTTIKKNEERTEKSAIKKNEEQIATSAIKKNEEQTATSAIKKNEERTAKSAIKKNKERTATSATNKNKERTAKSAIKKNSWRRKRKRTLIKQINAITRTDLLFSMLGTAGSRKSAPAFEGPQQPQLALTAPIVAQQQNAFMPLTCTATQPMCTSVPLIKATSQSTASLPLTCVAARPMGTSVPLIRAASHSTALLPISNTAAPRRLTPVIITATQDNQQLTLSFSVNSELLSDICRPWAREGPAGGPSRLRTHELTRVQPYGHRVTIHFDSKTHFQHGVAMKARGHRFVHSSEFKNSCLRLFLNNNSHMPLYQLLQVDERVKSGEIFWSRYLYRRFRCGTQCRRTLLMRSIVNRSTNQHFAILIRIMVKDIEIFPQIS